MNIKIRTCQSCGSNYTLKESYSKYCLTCRKTKRQERDISSHTLGYYRNREGVHPSWLMSEIRGHCRSINRRHRKQACQVCGYDFYVECAHIRAIKDFPDDALIADVNAETNVLILCPNHHKEFDRSSERRNYILSVV